MLMYFVSKDYKDGTVAVTDTSDNVTERFSIAQVKATGERVWGVDGNKITVYTDKVDVFRKYELRQRLAGNRNVEYQIKEGILKGERFIDRVGIIDVANKEALEHFEVLDFVDFLSKDLFLRCKLLKSVVLPEGLLKVEDLCFAGCALLESVDLPYSLKHLGEEAFANCYSLQNVTIHKGIGHIPSGCFYGCRSLQRVKICEGITEICESAFMNCSNLTTVELPKSLRKIDVLAFSGTAIRSLVLPNNVKLSSMAGLDSGCRYFEKVVVKRGTVAHKHILENGKPFFMEVVD